MRWKDFDWELKSSLSFFFFFANWLGKSSLSLSPYIFFFDMFFLFPYLNKDIRVINFFLVRKNKFKFLIRAELVLHKNQNKCKKCFPLIKNKKGVKSVFQLNLLSALSSWFVNPDYSTTLKQIRELYLYHPSLAKKRSICAIRHVINIGRWL